VAFAGDCGDFACFFGILRVFGCDFAVFGVFGVGIIQDFVVSGVILGFVFCGIVGTAVFRCFQGVFWCFLYFRVFLR